MQRTSNAEFWKLLDALIESSEIVIDRPKGSAHPKYADMIYPMDYGYLKDTRSMDGQGIDLWRGSMTKSVLRGIIVIADGLKRDSEIKLLIGVTDEEAQEIERFHNGNGDSMRGICIYRDLEVCGEMP